MENNFGTKESVLSGLREGFKRMQERDTKISIDTEKFKVIFPAELRYDSRFGIFKEAVSTLPTPKSVNIDQFQIPIKKAINVLTNQEMPDHFVPTVVQFRKVLFEGRPAWDFEFFT